MPFIIRAATLDERPAIRTLIERSARGLGVPEYRPEQIEAALQAAFGVDSQLIADGTYFVAGVECDPDRGLIACGGWSKRRTLYGGDARAGRDAGLLDPAVDAAKIRAFIVDPDFSRQGLGSLLLAHCEAAAMAAGFQRLEMMATLPGVKLYALRGYLPSAQIELELAPGIRLELVPMSKQV
jgi:GNAT superfamily N-acetyltransferase